MTGSRQRAERRGREGEAEAAQWLALRGWRVLAERVKTPRGEIDLIARKGSLLGFFEVKWRARCADLADAIDERRLRRVAAAAEIVAADYAEPGDDFTIDVLLLAPGRPPRHIANAYQP
ncbi:YraN family protein [Erythrobacter sp. HL-111]|uniref:YraN family protein n=1 Tax=Erythrobacter sp. HL-111 TaxID=1798193 RepID=UPI0006D9541F|nr:YraN family protein [Erythrobacter sp. HL-111]KPP86394.1 MAG: putative endonuclease [Erythrobacteraceae bacterium HL-111]SDR94036.1 putative endonuclease [Erythrobacter sp. HL-111]